MTKRLRAPHPEIDERLGFPLLVLLGACSKPAHPPVEMRPSDAKISNGVPIDAGAEGTRGSAELHDAGLRSEPILTEAEVDPAEARMALGYQSELPPRCREVKEAAALVRCELLERHAADPRAREQMIALYDRTGDVVGTETGHFMDGGFRGMIRLIPALPVGQDQKHLQWVDASARDFDTFFSALRQRGGAKIRYRHRAILFRFMRSVGRTTPSAYASGWSVSYNLSGSLLKNADGVRETLFHEIFHLNDTSHDDWSAHTLPPIYDKIVARCGTRVDCLQPYAPNSTQVRGGTYYAFQPDNGLSVHEYAAELALRYYKEQRAELGHGPRPNHAFKCGPPENRAAWTGLVDEFFGGVDLVPPCP